MTRPLRPLLALRRSPCWRLVRVESAPLAELVEPALLPALAAFLETTTGLREDPEAAERPFRAPNPSGSRFSDGSFGVFYAGRDLDTALAEIAYHQARWLRESDAPPMRLHFAALKAQVAGRFVDVRRGHARLHRPGGYAESRVFGIRAWRAGADGIAYRSVRRPGGECLAVFRRTCIVACARGGLVALAWDGSALAPLGA